MIATHDPTSSWGGGYVPAIIPTAPGPIIPTGSGGGSLPVSRDGFVNPWGAGGTSSDGAEPILPYGDVPYWEPVRATTSGPTSSADSAKLFGLIVAAAAIAFLVLR